MEINGFYILLEHLELFFILLSKLQDFILKENL